MKLRRVMSEREVWVKANTILAEHGAMTVEYIFDQLGDVLDDDIAVEEWRRVSVAIDAITAAASDRAN